MESARILLVEDNCHDARLLQRYLQRAGRDDLAITHVETLEAALATLARDAYDVVLLDFSLPDSVGLATLQSVLEQAPNTPIVVFTGLDDDALGTQAVQCGASDYLLKGRDDGPATVRALTYAIERHRVVARLRAFDRLKSDFLNTASHEMRTPLTIIREFLSLVVDGVTGPINAEQADCLGAALRNCDRLAALLNDLLDLSKLESRQAELRRDRTNLARLLEEARGDFARVCAERGQTLRLDCPPDLPPVLCDEAKIHQVLVNLLGNAHKFTPDNGVLTLGAQRQEAGVTLFVQDTGKGIAPEDQAAIFDAFIQIDRQDGPGTRGTGLGLAITRRILQLHQSAISVVSAPGEGSRFAFDLPLYDAHAHLLLSLADRSQSARQSAQSLTLVLLRLTPGDALALGSVPDDPESALTRLRALVEAVVRPADAPTPLPAEGELALLLDTDLSGAQTILARLCAHFAVQSPALRLQAALGQRAPEQTLTLWLAQTRAQFAPLPFPSV